MSLRKGFEDGGKDEGGLVVLLCSSEPRGSPQLYVLTWGTIPAKYSKAEKIDTL